MKRLLVCAALCLLLAAAPIVSFGQRALRAPDARPDSVEFLRAADEVLEEVSRLVSLPVKAPLKKSLRTRDEIRAFVLKEMEEDREEEKWYADQRALERFGLLPRDFPLDQVLLELLTEQVAGLYDPKSKEFYIADWIELSDLRSVLAHELVHALQDQHFDLEAWLRAARPNDDAVMARHALLEGSAMAGMFDYMLRESKASVRDVPGFSAVLRAETLSQMASSPQLAKAPVFLRDALLFPYIEGAVFSQEMLKKREKWSEFYRVFEAPPLSTQQVLHPELYHRGVQPAGVALPELSGPRAAQWKKLDNNVMGEFGVHAVLKAFLGNERAARLSPSWVGDRYAIYERAPSRETLLVFRLVLASEADAARFFGAYSEALERKHTVRNRLIRRNGFFAFDTPRDGSVFLYCRLEECLTVEGSDRALFDSLIRQLKWPVAPALPPPRGARIAAVPGRTALATP